MKKIKIIILSLDISMTKKFYSIKASSVCVQYFWHFLTYCDVINVEHSSHEKGGKKKTIGLAKIMLISTYVTERSNEKGAQTLWRIIDQSRLTHPDFPQIRHMFHKIIFEFKIDFIDRKIKEKKFNRSCYKK